MSEWWLNKSVVTHLQPSENTHMNIMESDYEYVLDCALNCNATSIGLALSTKTIQLRDYSTLQLQYEFNAHSDPITELWASKAHAWKFMSSSRDETVRIWDTRTQRPSLSIAVNDQVWSMDVNADETVCVAGSNACAHFFDLRTGKRLGKYDESHVDAVTKVKFHPVHETHVVTASEDGIICLFDCRVALEEDALQSILNVESAVANFTFFGPKCESIVSLTSTETLDLWNLMTAERHEHHPTVREKCAEMNVPIEYLIDCHYDPIQDQLYLLAGDHKGTMQVFEFQKDFGLRPIQTLKGGHKACVRCVSWTGENKIFTGGEDARLSLWSTTKPSLNNDPISLKSTTVPTPRRFTPY